MSNDYFVLSALCSTITPTSSEHLAAPNFSNQSISSFCEQVFLKPEVFLALGIISLLENILVILAVVRNGKLQSLMYIFLCSLAMADMPVSVSNALETLMIPVVNSDYRTFKDQFIQHMDNVFDSMICISLVAPICNLLAIAVNRYTTIYILRYHSIMTVLWKVLALIAAIWLGCRVCSVVFVIYSESKMVIVCLITMFLVMLLLMGTLYVHVLLFTLLHIEHIAAQLPANGVAHWPAALVYGGGNRHHQPAGGLHLLLGPLLPPPRPHHNLPHQPHCICYTAHSNSHLVLIMCTTIINLVIYAFRSLELRNTFKEMLCSCNGMNVG